VFKMAMQTFFDQECFEKEIDIPFIPYKGLILNFGNGERFEVVSTPEWDVKRSLFVSGGWKFIGCSIGINVVPKWVEEKKAELTRLGWINRGVLSS
jgi:hypothetical protein